MQQPIDHLIEEIARSLTRLRWRIVFAESCTGGLVSSIMARIPGISESLCGSAVVYRLDTKSRWLAVPESMLLDPGPVSEPVAKAMAEGVLSRTPEAEISASVTGHLGPNAPPDQDGLIYVGIARRGRGCRVVPYWLPKFDSATVNEPYAPRNQRERRQSDAAEFVLSQVATTLRAEIIATDFDVPIDT